MRRRWPRTAAAVLVTSGAGALGAGFLAAGAAQAAQAAPDATPCGLLNACPPTGTITGSPGSAGGTITVTWKSPAGMNADTSGKTGSLKITWTPSGQIPVTAPSPPVAVSVPSGTCVSPPGSTDLVCTYAWPSELMVNKYVLNGTYALNATADDCALPPIGPCSSPATADQTLAVTNNPSAPTKVSAVLVQNNAAVKITWNANPEPDIVGYQVLRADNSLACQVPATVGSPTTYSCVDSPTKDGKYAYTVVAYRWGATYSTALMDEKAGPPSGVTTPLSVSGTSANTTTTVAGGPSARLGPGGFAPNLAPVHNGTTSGGATFNPKLAAPATTPAVATDTPANGDSGFQPTLPYGQRAAPPTTSDPAVITAPAPHKGKTSVGSIAVVGAGLLLAVIALHGLWLRSEVRRPGALEVLEPDA